MEAERLLCYNIQITLSWFQFKKLQSHLLNCCLHSIQHPFVRFHPCTNPNFN